MVARSHRSLKFAALLENVVILYTAVVFHRSVRKALIPGGIMAILDILPLDISTSHLVGKIGTSLPA
jgi:hypothetical protein